MIKSESKPVFLEPRPMPYLQHLINHNNINNNSMDNNNTMVDNTDLQDIKDPLCPDQLQNSTQIPTTIQSAAESSNNTADAGTVAPFYS